jgi:hypothetical protein
VADNASRAAWLFEHLTKEYELLRNPDDAVADSLPLSSRVALPEFHHPVLQILFGDFRGEGALDRVQEAFCNDFKGTNCVGMQGRAVLLDSGPLVVDKCRSKLL